MRMNTDRPSQRRSGYEETRSYKEANLNKKLSMIGILCVLALFFVAPAMAAEQGGAAAQSGTNWFVVLPAFAMAIASSVCALGQSKAIVAACESVSRNPGASDSIRFFLILGLVLIESLALYTLLIIFAK